MINNLLPEETKFQPKNNVSEANFFENSKLKIDTSFVPFNSFENLALSFKKI